MRDVIVIGGGQAGLAAGYWLRRAGLRFEILDAGEEIGASWRARWDSLRLFTPSRYNALPGMPFPGAPYALPSKDEVAAYLRRYAATFDLPVRPRTVVSSLRRVDGRFEARTAEGRTLASRAVIVATGANQRPHVPDLAAALSSRILQLHSSAYRRPADVPQGRVLVVGAGNSGVQVACELADAGREVLLSGRDTGSMPRRLLGRDIYDWLWPTVMRPTVDSAIGARLMKGRLFSGDPLIGMKPGAVAGAGVVRVGRTIAVEHGDPVVERDGRLEDITAIVWCTGFRPDYSWIEMPLLGLDGYPAHRRGIAEHVDGIGFLGMRFQHRVGSALLGGVGEDAEWVVRALAQGLQHVVDQTSDVVLHQPSG